MLIATHQRARVIVGHRTVRVVKHSCVSLMRLCDMFRALLLRQCLVNFSDDELARPGKSVRTKSRD